jgi:hypothetical protein
MDLENKRKEVHPVSKKIIALIAIAAVTILMAVPALADSGQDNGSWFESMFTAKKAWVDQAVKDGRITAEQGETWKNHFDQMYQLHRENGFNCPMGGPGAGFGMGRGPGFGGGGGGWGLNQAPAQQ